MWIDFFCSRWFGEIDGILFGFFGFLVFFFLASWLQLTNPAYSRANVRSTKTIEKHVMHEGAKKVDRHAITGSDPFFSFFFFFFFFFFPQSILPLNLISVTNSLPRLFPPSIGCDHHDHHQHPEMILYAAFLIIFSFVLLNQRDAVYSFWYNELMKDLFLGEEFPSDNSTEHVQILKTFYDVATTDELWQARSRSLPSSVSILLFSVYDMFPLGRGK